MSEKHTPVQHSRGFLYKFILCATVLAVTACGGGEDTLGAPALPAAIRGELRATIDSVVQQGIAPGVSLAFSGEGYQQWTGTAGLASRETRELLTEVHQSRAGSALKMSVAIATLQLVEQSSLSLNDTLEKVLPVQISSQVPNAKMINIRMLLNHTSGIPDCCEDDFDSLVSGNQQRNWTTDDFLERAARQQPLFAPGDGWSYSNTNYVLLGEVISTVAKQPWRKVVTERVFKRANLKRSDLPLPGNNRCAQCARGYESIDGQLIDHTEVDPSMAGAAGGHAWVTTPSDMVILLRALFDGQLFDSSKSLTEMLSFVSIDQGDESLTGYGLGLMRLEQNQKVWLGHIGGTAGYLNFMFYQPNSGTAVSGFITKRDDLRALLEPVLDISDRTPPMRK